MQEETNTGVFILAHGAATVETVERKECDTSNLTSHGPDTCQWVVAAMGDSDANILHQCPFCTQPFGMLTLSPSHNSQLLPSHTLILNLS